MNFVSTIWSQKYGLENLSLLQRLGFLVFGFFIYLGTKITKFDMNGETESKIVQPYTENSIKLI